MADNPTDSGGPAAAADTNSSNSPKTLSVAEQLEQLNAARKLVLEQPAYYDRIVKGVLPIIGPNAALPLRRWGAEFLAESLATPVLSTRDKENLVIAVLDTLRSLLEGVGEDLIVLKACVGAAASAYPVTLRWIIHNSYYAEPWEQMTAIKSRILNIWDSAPAPIKISCIKFAQRVVLAQTASNGMEQKYNGLDVSLNMIPPNHNLLDPRHLEAEATGLLDRMLGVLQDNSSNALMVDATLNCLSILIRTRPSTSNRIINAILNFNPLKLATMSPMTPTTRMHVKSMEKTTRMFLTHLIKRDPANPFNGRIQQYLERLMRAKAELLDDARKRALSEQGYPMDAKRQKVEGAVPFVVPPLGPGPHSLASVFTLTNNAGLQAFDATLIPAPLAAKISIRALATISPAVIDAAINGVRDRLAALYAAGASDAAAATAAVAPSVLNPATAPLGVDDDDDDYEPDLTPAEDTEQILNKLDNAPPEVPLEEENHEDSAALALGPFKLPSPPATDADSASKAVPSLATRLFELLPHLKESAGRKKAGFNRLAGSQDDRDWFATVIIRLATRGTSNLSGLFPSERALIKQEDGTVRPGLGDAIREILYNHVFEDWRRNIDTAIAWLTEEWYCDQVAKATAAGNGASLQMHYEKWALRVMDGFINYITAQDKLLTRFLAEIPELTRPLLGKLKVLCEDPTTVQLALTSLLYLVMTKPPAKELALDMVGEIWTEYEDARPLAAKYLVKYRPGWIEAQLSRSNGN